MKRTFTFFIYAGAFAMAILFLAIPLTMLSSSYKNTLMNQPEWGVSKRRISMELMGVTSYEEGTQALADNCLHLDAWHGYHEVMHRTMVNPRQVKFSFYLGENSWICLVFGRPRVYAYDTENYFALRLSTSSDKPDALLQVAASGEFLDRTLLQNGGAVKSEAWNRCEVNWNDETGTIEVAVNGQPLDSLAGAFHGQQYIGFRGGAHTASVDDVAITEDSGRRHVYSFGWYEGLNRDSILRDILVTIMKVFLALVALLFLCRLLAGNFRTGAAATLSLAATVLLTLWPWVLYSNYVMASRYPVVNSALETIERSLVDDGIEAQKESILTEYPEGDIFPENTAILIGTSQTWGCGATFKEDAWAMQASFLLNDERAASEVLLINGAVKGATSATLFPYYEDFLSHYPHKLLVLVLGCNDRDADLLEQNLVRFVLLARNLGVKPVIVVEALSYEETPHGTGNLPVMHAVAKEYEVPFFDMHEAVKEYRDDGFFWWDVVHPTSFGHACIARELAPFIRECLETE